MNVISRLFQHYNEHHARSDCAEGCAERAGCVQWGVVFAWGGLQFALGGGVFGQCDDWACYEYGASVQRDIPSSAKVN